MRLSTGAMSSIVASVALVACAEQVIVFQAQPSDAGGTPSVDDSFDAAFVDGGPTQRRAASADGRSHRAAPPDDADKADGPTIADDADEGTVGCATDPRVDGYTSDMSKLGDRRALR